MPAENAAAPAEVAVEQFDTTPFRNIEEAKAALALPLKSKAALDNWIVRCTFFESVTTLRLYRVGRMGSNGCVENYYDVGFLDSNYLRNVGCDRPTGWQAADLTAGGGAYMHPHNWAAYRDALRMSLCVWESALQSAQRIAPHLAQLFPHTSKDDPTQIAYVPDRTAAEQDKQLRTSPEKFLRKYLPLCTEKWMTELAREWQQSRDPRINWVDFSAEDLATIEQREGYQSVDFISACRYGSGNSRSCMRYDHSEYSTSGRHPMEAYLAPGFRVATLRADMDNPLGDMSDVTTRAICWVNPDDPTDKRYTRLYPVDGSAGTRRLETNLKREGYVHSTFEGARLRRINVNKLSLGNGKYCHKVVAPYIDGLLSPSDSECGRYLVLDGDEFLRVLDHDEREALLDSYSASDEYQGADYHAPRAASTCGVVAIYDMPSNEWTCARTGSVYSFTDAAPKPVWDGDNFYDRAYYSGTNNTIVYGYDSSGRHRGGYAVSGTFEYAGSVYIDNTETRKALDFAKPVAKHYPDITDWVHAGDLSEDTEWVRVEEGAILRADMVALIARDSGYTALRSAHKNDVPEGSEAVHRLSTSVPCFAAPGVVVKRTGTGKKVVQGIHSLVTVVTGTLELSSTVMAARNPFVTNATAYIRRDADEADLTYSTPVQALVDDVCRKLNADAMCADTLGRKDRMYSKAIQSLRFVPGTNVLMDARPRVFAYDEAIGIWEALVVKAKGIAQGTFVFQPSEHLTQDGVDKARVWETRWAEAVLLMHKALLEGTKTLEDATARKAEMEKAEREAADAMFLANTARPEGLPAATQSLEELAHAAGLQAEFADNLRMATTTMSFSNIVLRPDNVTYTNAA